MDRLPSIFGSAVPELLVFEIVSGGQGTLDDCPLPLTSEAKDILAGWSLIAYLKANLPALDFKNTRRVQEVCWRRAVPCWYLRVDARVVVGIQEPLETGRHPRVCWSGERQT